MFKTINFRGTNYYINPNNICYIAEVNRTTGSRVESEKYYYELLIHFNSEKYANITFSFKTREERSMYVSRYFDFLGDGNEMYE